MLVRLLLRLLKSSLVRWLSRRCRSCRGLKKCGEVAAVSIRQCGCCLCGVLWGIHSRPLSTLSSLRSLAPFANCAVLRVELSPGGGVPIPDKEARLAQRLRDGFCCWVWFGYEILREFGDFCLAARQAIRVSSDRLLPNHRQRVQVVVHWVGGVLRLMM